LSARCPRVLFVGAFPPPESVIVGGMVTSCRALLASTLPQRVELDLLDSTQFANPPPRLSVRFVRAALRCVRFVVRFEARRPDAVLLFVALGASIVEKGAMAWYARLRGVPTLMFPRGASIVEDCRTSGFTRTWAKASFRGARKIVCQGQIWRNFAVDVLGFAPQDVAVIRNWTATRDLLDIGACRSARRRAPIRLLFVGWLERDKGILELLEACQQLGRERQFTLDIAGEGHASEEARGLVSRYGLTEVVRFLGWLQPQELRRALADADVFVLPSWGEGLPNAMVEAMAARLAVVVTSVGAIPDVITHRRSGLLVAPKDMESLRLALSEIIDDGDLRDRLALEAYEIATQEFAVEAAVEKLVHEIDSTIFSAHAIHDHRRVP
jgi:glycosyltransferase involved in cell wall biosynthesis